MRLATRPDYSGEVLTGPQAIFSAEAARREKEAREIWPYPWEEPPIDSKHRMPMGTVVSPAVGAANQALILQFGIPTGYRFYLGAILIGAFQGPNQIPAGTPGQDFICSIDLNTPLLAPATQSSPIEDWSNIQFNLGSLWYGPMRLRRAREFTAQDVLRAKAINVSLGVGAPNYFCAMFEGYLVPVNES